jgi:hypothetical protein
MRATMLTGHTCPTCDAYTVAQANSKSDYCPSCHTVVTRFRNVKVVQPNAQRMDGAIR